MNIYKLWKATRQIMSVKIKVKYDATKLHRNLDKIIKKTMSRYARSSAKGAKKNIDKGVKTITPHSEGSGLRTSTLNIRQKRGITGTKPLFETGNLYRSIKAKKDTLTMLDYGMEHQEGFTTKANSMIPKKKVLPRPFIEPDKQEILTVIDAFKRDLHKNFKK